MKIGPEKLSHEVPGADARCQRLMASANAYRSSSGDIKTSLKLMICHGACEWMVQGGLVGEGGPHVLMLNVFQKLQLTVGPLRQYGCTEGFHDLLHSDGDACKLVLCGTVGPALSMADKCEEMITNQTRPNAPGEKARIRTEDCETMASRTHSDGLKVNISSCDLGKRRRGWSGKGEFSGRSVREARLEGGPKDGEFDERHFTKSGGQGEEEEAQRTGKGQRQGESDIPKWQADEDYISRGTGFGASLVL